MKKKRNRYANITTVGACLGMAMGGALGHAATLDDLTKENETLKTRLDAIEALAQKEGLLPSGKPAPKFIGAMSDIMISGFVQASYFYNTKHPTDKTSDGYLWNTSDNSFSINKVKLTIASKPVATDKWDAGFKASFIWGEDAPNLNSPPGAPAAPGNTGFSDLREAYVELNVPIGTGLNVKAGELISLLNYESGDGGAANMNFSQGNQWWFTGNGPSAGVQASYNFTDKVALTLRVDNGLFQGPVDNNEGKAFSGSLNIKPCSKSWVNVYGFWDDQPGGFETKGFGTIGGYQVSAKLGTGFEFDYFNFDNGTTSSDLWSIGGWAWYDMTSKLGLAFRADYIGSPDGQLGPAVRPNAGILSVDPDGSLASFTLTLNFKPTPNLKIQPEIRYDTTSFAGGLDGHTDRIIIGAGATYLF